LLARFCKEDSFQKVAEMIPDRDYMDIGVRQENLQVRGEPIMLQLCVVPSYALTIHKTQALSIKHQVIGCLEGVFAMGQVYVLASRVTEPRNFVLVGIPPKDMLDDVAAAFKANGLNIDECFRRACSVTNEWKYDSEACWLKDRFQQRFCSEHSIPLKRRTLEETLNPQPDATVVIKNLLDWIDKVDESSRTGAPKPAFETEAGEPIFPPDPEDKWWLTDVSKRAEPEKEEAGDEDGPASDLEEDMRRDASDSDPLSEHEGVGAAQGRGAKKPVVGWQL